jgi:hypothetical protein
LVASTIEVVVPETAPVVDETAKVMAELAAFEAAREPVTKEAPPTAGEKAPAKAGSNAAEKGTSGVAAPVSTDESPAQETAETPPVAETTVDLSGLPDDLRKVIEESALPSEVKKKVNEGFLRRKDYTQKTQALASDRDAAAKYKQIVSNERIAKKVAELLMGKGDADEAPADPVEPEAEIDPVLDPRGYSDAVAKKAEAKAVATMERIWRERVDAPMENRAALNAAFSRFADEHEVPKGVMQSAVSALIAEANEAGIPLSPALIPVLVKPHVELARLKTASVKAPEKNGAMGNGRAGGLAEVASPNGRIGASGGSTIPVPKHIREGKVAVTEAEISEEVEYAIRRRFGPDAS